MICLFFPCIVCIIVVHVLKTKIKLPFILARGAHLYRYISNCLIDSTVDVNFCEFVQKFLGQSKVKINVNVITILYTPLNSRRFIFALWRSETDSPGIVLNSPTLQFSYIILYLNWPCFKFALRSEGEKGEYKTGQNFPSIQYRHLYNHI